MMSRSTRYGAVAQGAHWLVVLLVAALFGIAWYMTDLPLGPEKIETYNLHKSIGVLVLAVMLLRLLWRRISPPPPLPPDMAAWERMAAHASHALELLHALFGMRKAHSAGDVIIHWVIDVFAKGAIHRS